MSRPAAAFVRTNTFEIDLAGSLMWAGGKGHEFPIDRNEPLVDVLFRAAHIHAKETGEAGDTHEFSMPTIAAGLYLMAFADPDQPDRFWLLYADSGEPVKLSGADWGGHASTVAEVLARFEATAALPDLRTMT